MTAILQHTDVIRERFEIGVRAAEGDGFVIVYDNDPLNETKINLSNPWMRVFVNDVSTRRRSIGASQGLHITEGFITAEIRQPSGTGDADIRRIAERVKDSFRDLNTQGVEFRDPRVQPIGLEGVWWRLDVVIDYRVWQTLPSATDE